MHQCSAGGITLAHQPTQFRGIGRCPVATVGEHVARRVGALDLLREPHFVLSRQERMAPDVVEIQTDEILVTPLHSLLSQAWIILRGQLSGADRALVDHAPLPTQCLHSFERFTSGGRRRTPRGIALRAWVRTSRPTSDIVGHTSRRRSAGRRDQRQSGGLGATSGDAGA